MMWLIMILMMLVAVILLVYPLRKSKVTDPDIDSNTANVAILKDQLTELDNELENGSITQSFYDDARKDLELSVAADLTTDSAAVSTSLAKNTRYGLAGLLVVFVCMGSFWFYQGITTFQGEAEIAGTTSPSDSGAAETAQNTPPLSEMADVLAARLREKPDDARGWFMMGKTYMLLDRKEDAVGAFDMAYQIVGDTDANLLADYAEALAYLNGDSMMGRPSTLVNSALLLEPDHAKSLWLAGFAAMQHEAYVAAINHWQKLLGNEAVPENTRQLATQYIQEAKALAGLPEDGAVSSEEEGAAEISNSPDGVAVSVQVSLDDKLKTQVEQDEIVYVFAKASEGMPMPLAVQRLTVADLPAEVLLDDSMAMLQGNHMSAHEAIIVGARVSRDGTPIARPGDLEGLGEVINPRETSRQAIIINRVVN